MLDGKQPLSFKRAVFLSEDAYYGDSLNFRSFCILIEYYKELALAYNKTNRLMKYNAMDSLDENLNGSLFKVFTDTVWSQGGHIVSLPFQYNFDDALGCKELSSVFVSTLLASRKGNCRSLPYLYKILTEELGTKSYLALAPMHVYIKQRNKNIGWYNVELTSGQYPKDAFLISTGYISQDNIRSGLYMDTLSLRETVALCLMDLCSTYHKVMGELSDPAFELNCCNKALEVKPNLLDGLLTKQRLHRMLWKRYENAGWTELALENKTLYNETNLKLTKLDYRDVPQETFEKWYSAYQQNKNLYTNQQISTTFISKTE